MHNQIFRDWMLDETRMSGYIHFDISVLFQRENFCDNLVKALAQLFSHIDQSWKVPMPRILGYETW